MADDASSSSPTRPSHTNDDAVMTPHDGETATLPKPFDPTATKVTNDSVAGFLKKQNKWGFWQRRYFLLKNDELTYYDNEMLKKPRPSVKVDKAELEGRFGEFIVETEDDMFSLRAKTAREAQLWVNAVELAEQRATEALDKERQELNKRHKRDTKMSWKDMEGYLQMPSASRFKEWQDRYFRLKGQSLFYYKSEANHSDDYEGEIVLIDPNSFKPMTVEKIETISNGRGILIVTPVRSCKLKAPSPDSADDWVKAISQRCDSKRLAAMHEMDEEKSEDSSFLKKQTTNVPEWINRWDAVVADENIKRVHHHLDAYFPHTMGQGSDDLQTALNAVTSIIEELEDKARECLPRDGVPGQLTEAGRYPRPDVFEIILRFYHIRIVNELSQFAADQNYDQFSMRELLRFMDLITAYDSKINELLVGEVGQQMKGRIPQFALLDNAENMAKVYLDKSRSQIAIWVDNVVFESTGKGEARVFVRLDGRFQTPGPTDLFNLLNEALTLAKVSGVKRLQANVVSLCAVSLADYINAVVKDLTVSSNKSNSLPYCCAVANDCWSVIDHVDRLEREQKNEMFIVDFEPLREKCALYAQKCLEMLALMVRADLRGTLSKAFTADHLRSVRETDDAVAVAVATLDDYMGDFTVILELPFVSRVARLLIRDLIADYLARLCMAYREEGLSALGKRDVDLISLDRKRVLECLERMFPNMDVLRLFHGEFSAMEDVMEMLCNAPSLIPSSAVKFSQRDPFLRLHVLSTAKMCVDFSCNGALVGLQQQNPMGNDKMIKEIKGIIVTDIDEKVPSPPGNGVVSEDAFEMYERCAYVRMWPTLKRPTKVPSAASFKPGSQAERDHERSEMMRRVAPVMVENKDTIKMKGLLARQTSTQWRPPTKPVEAGPIAAVAPAAVSAVKPAVVTQQAVPQVAAKPAPAAPAPPAKTTTAPVAAVAATAAAAATTVLPPPPAKNPTSVFESILRVREGKSSTSPEMKCLCELKPISETHMTDLVFIVHQNLLASSPISFRALVSDIARVEYWATVPVPAPMHFGPDAKDVQDAPNAPGRTANRDVEFAIGTRQGQHYHFTADAVSIVAQWVKSLKKAVSESYVKWGSTYVEGEEEYLKMSAKQLKNLAKSRGLDTGDCVEKSDLIRVLKNNAPLLKGVVAAGATASKLAAPVSDDGPAMNPGLTINSSLFSKTAEAPKVAPVAVPVVLPAAAPAPAVVIKPIAVVSSTTAIVPPSLAPKPMAAAAAPAAAASAIAPKPAVAVIAASAIAPKPAVAPTAAVAAPVIAAAAAIAAPRSAPPPTAEPPANEQAVLEVQSLIFRGMQMMDDNEPNQAMQIFVKAKDQAAAIGSIQLRAKATAGLASAYRDIPSMRRAAGPMFEVAASLFQSSGDTSDRINVITEAVDVYLRLNMFDEALKCMERYDTSAKRLGQPLMFEQKIKEVTQLKATARR